MNIDDGLTSIRCNVNYSPNTAEMVSYEPVIIVRQGASCQGNNDSAFVMGHAAENFIVVDVRYEYECTVQVSGANATEGIVNIHISIFLNVYASTKISCPDEQIYISCMLRSLGHPILADYQ